jgi:hypothetical protein
VTPSPNHFTDGNGGYPYLMPKAYKIRLLASQRICAARFLPGTVPMASSRLSRALGGPAPKPLNVSRFRINTYKKPG